MGYVVSLHRWNPTYNRLPSQIPLGGLGEAGAAGVDGVAHSPELVLAHVLQPEPLLVAVPDVRLEVVDPVAGLAAQRTRLHVGPRVGVLVAVERLGRRVDLGAVGALV